MTHSVYDFLTASSGTSLLLLMAFKSAAILLLGLLLWNLLAKASASTRHLVLVTTMLAAFATPLITMFVPPLELTVRTPPSVAEKQSPLPVSAGNASTPIGVAASAVVTETKISNIVTVSSSRNLAVYVVVSIAGLAAMLVAHLGLGVFHLWRLSRRATVIDTNNGWYDLMPFESRGRVTLLQSDDLTAPYTWGFYKPVIVLPVAAQYWSRQNKTNALLHEISHVDRYDWLCQIVARFVCSVYWFNPLAWMVYRKLILEAERAADDRVLLAGNRAHDYAEQLIELTRASGDSHVLPLAATTMAAKSLLTNRVHSILNSGAHRMPLHILNKYAVISSIATLSLLIGVTQLVAAEDGSIASSRSTTPLIHAAATGDHTEVERLIAAGANVNKTHRERNAANIYQRTALTTAARAGHVDVVATLLDAGAPVDRVVSGDATALIAALRKNHVDVAQLLLDHGANVGLTVRGDGSPLIAATRSGNSDFVAQLLRQGADPDEWVRGDENALFHAARKGNANIVQLLIDAGADVNKKMPGDGNALIIATRKQHKDVIKILLNAGARPDAGVRGDGNAMITAAKHGDTATLSSMISTGANVNASVKGDGSPLIAAARNGHTEAVQLLLDNGAAIDKVVYGDENALIGASWAGDLSMVQLLLKAGANPNIKAETYNGKFRSALSQAKREGHDEIIRTLKAAGARE